MNALVGSIVMALILPSYLVALRRLRRMEEREGAGGSWWFGYVRDAVNLAGALLLWIAFGLGGLSGPAALALAIATALVSYSLDWLLGKWLGLGGAIWLLAPLLVVASSTLLWLPAVGEGLGALIRTSAPR